MRIRKGRRGHFKTKLLLILFLILIGCSYIGIKLQPIILSYASNIVQNRVTYAVNRVIENQMYQNREEYASLVQLDHDDDSHVTALRTDVISINRMKAQIVDAVYGSVEDLVESTLSIPIGSIIAPTWVGGYGPKIPVHIVGLGTVKADFASAFSQSGINQTRHNIVLEVHVQVNILTPVGSEATKVNSSFYVTDTIIVGSVPEQYTYIEDTSSSLLGKINDYGAQDNTSGN